MENKQEKSTLGTRLASIFKSRTARGLIIIGFMILSLFCMLLMDRGNGVREKYFSSLDSNFLADILDNFNIERFNIGLKAWVLFFLVMAALAIFLVADMCAGIFVNKWAQSKAEKYGSLKKAKRLCSWHYYTIVLLLIAACIFIFFMAGGKDIFHTPSQGVFVNFAYTMLICLIFMAIIVLMICILGVIVSGIIGGVKLVASPSRVNEVNGVKNVAEEKKAPVSGKDLFPALTAIDIANEGEKEASPVDDLTLEEFALRFQSYAANTHKIYYGMGLIRSFMAGMSASHLIILEGLSGTGKSMLPRMFSGFVKGNAFFAPVQATWRDKSDIVGFYSEFTKTFKTTDFLRDLYSVSYSDKTTMMVLDEMNISRIEYYFADFLSIIEYPQDQWKVKVYEPELNQELPAKLTNGYVTIPSNTWFIGTANTDDSTFTITDKVYDRAITLDFRERMGKITSDYASDPVNMTAERLLQMFEEAKANPAFCLTEEETNKFLKVSRFIRDAFDIHFGNRIMVQIEQFVPVYVALGGTKEAALDFLLASKVLRKLEGLFEDYVKDELVSLTKLLHTTYGKGVFVESERIIEKILKRLV